MATEAAAALDEAKIGEFVHQVLGEMGATLNAALVVIGDKLGLYEAMSEAGPIAPGELAQRTGTTERYVREWLNAQAAGGYVEYDPDELTYTLPPEHAFVLSNENSPFFMAGAFELMTASVRDEPKIREAFRSGAGVGWHEHDHGVFDGCERFFRPGYAANLVSSWLPALDGVEEKLKAGAIVADVGCGHGASTILMAEAYPNSHFIGFDYHDGSIEQARIRAQEAGLGERVVFEVASASEFNGHAFDLVTTFDCLHDMGDPLGAAKHVRAQLEANGTWMIVEPFAGDRVEDNLNPVGRVYYAASTLLCTPASLSQEVGLALGAQAGEARLRDVITGGGFGRFRRAAETPFNIVLEARP
jgi:SAM-dependent methyltransferase